MPDDYEWDDLEEVDDYDEDCGPGCDICHPKPDDYYDTYNEDEDD